MIGDRLRKNELLIILILAMCLAAGWLLYGSFGHQFIRSLYEGRSIGPLNQIIGSQDIHPLDFYLRKGDNLFYQVLWLSLYLCFSIFCVSFLKSSSTRIEVFVILLAIAIAVNSQFSALVNQYIINDDVRQHTWWMRQFQDRDLFNNDLLAEYARSIQPWGFLFLYYLLSFAADPVLIGKILPIILLPVSSLYMFRFVRHATKSDYTGFLGALIFMVTPIYLEQMSGGHARAFGYPLLILFLYYLARKEYSKSSMVVVVQALFQPITVLLSMLTYFFAFIKIQRWKIILDRSIPKIKFFALAAIFSAIILFGKYVVTQHPDIGSPVTLEQMTGNPEFYNANRWPVLPVPPLYEGIVNYAGKGVFISRTFRKSAVYNQVRSALLRRSVFLAAILVLAAGLFIFRKKLVLPQEILFLFLSGVMMFKISSLFMLRLYNPRRYLMYSMPLVALVVFTIVAGKLITGIKKTGIRKTVMSAVAVVVFLNLNVNKNVALIDMSANKNLYEYLNSLPKDTMIAAHPELADGIPTFARRKVFIKLELSVPLFDPYWSTVKNRTLDFFDAYYSEEPDFIYRFCEKNGIDYLVVDKSHFTEEYLGKGNIYFEPFNAHVIDLTSGRSKFALENIPESEKLFTRDDVFVIKRDVLKGKK